MKQRTAKRLRVAALVILSIATGGLMPRAALAEDSQGWALYQEFIAACETATSMDEILPFLPKWRHERNDASDEASRQETLGRLCEETRDKYTDIGFVNEESTDTETVLRLKASWQGFPMKGKVTLVREGDELKVEEWFWATGE